MADDKNQGDNMAKPRVLFLCVHNSARSQMAEAFLKKYSGNFGVMSAGLEAGTLNPYVVEAMKEKEIDISKNKTKSAFDLYKQGLTFSHVVTVCDRQAAERCPVFPGVTARLHWPFDDPSKFTGSHDEVMAKIRLVRDEIESKVKAFIEIVDAGGKFKKNDLF
jgi:arsenate reductase (thioredoxin)